MGEAEITLEIATDGSYSQKTKDGGWAFVADDTRPEGYRCGWEHDTTNNRMELLAVIKALQWVLDEFEPGHEVRIVTDSSYVVNCFRKKWHKMWENNGWLNSAGRPVQNKDLWGELLFLNKILKVHFVHVKGHQGRHKGNELADGFAQNARINRLSYG